MAISRRYGMGMTMLNEFIEYLIAQIGQPYLWGGQHTKLMRSNYKEVIARREEKEENRRLVEQYCEKLFDDGYEVLYAYDCSGLGCYWIYNLKHLWKCDVTADTMMKRCELREDLPKKGWWVFKYNGKKATHIGYMIDDQYLVEAKGRKYGVVRTKFKKKDWDKWGIPNVFRDDIINPDPDLKPQKGKMIKVKGFVRVREGNGKKFDPIPPTPSNCLLPYRGQAKEDPYWYETVWQGQYGFISSNPKYTEIVEAEI